MHGPTNIKCSSILELRQKPECNNAAT